ncbi:MAG: precorrin-6A reductase, partial [Gloeomargarita sp. SKYBB_i_bin120]|nr:precorrin-6A reductase [Gloeomargarita sp. SKYB120]MDW8179312.1 precorrin-6A reductase [Gloeomargarita sp. SKYBB_i_bin120]
MACLGSTYPCVITVTTDRAKQLYSDTSLRVVVTCLTPANISAFLQTYQITRILDMSHPHAAVISQLAIQCSEQYHLPYLRYERPSIRSDSPFCLYWRDLDELFTTYHFGCERILVTLGYRQLPRLKPYWGAHTWFVRILPDPVALTTALDVGFAPQNIIALWPPVSREMERALWQTWGITQVIAKASGAPGGEDIKQTVAQELGVVLHLLQRPAVSYPQQTDD